MASEHPFPGRIVHYISKKEPFVESPAMISGTSKDLLGMLDTAKEMAPVTMLGESMADALGDGYSSERHASLQVFGLVGVYPEWNIPYGREDLSDSVVLQPVIKAPGTWHWHYECGEYNGHIERA